MNLKYSINPPLMAIGDSLPQGCRSLTVKSEFCKNSYPALAASLANLAFDAPQHPRPVILDLELIASSLLESGLTGILGGFKANLDAWIADFEAPYDPAANKPECFDNLAVAGFTLEDISGSTKIFEGHSGYGTPELAENNFLRQYKAGTLPLSPETIADLHIAVNSRYVLNPSNNPAYMGWSQKRWVIERQPQNLIIHVGHNNGIYGIGAKGDSLALRSFSSFWPEPGITTLVGLVKDIRNQCPQTRILLLGFPKIGAVANLMPKSGTEKITGTDYFTHYDTVFPQRNQVPGNLIQDADHTLRDVNEKLKDELAAIGNTDFIDLYSVFELLDTKNQVKRAKRLTFQYSGDSSHDPRTFVLDNNYLSGQVINSGLFGRTSTVFSDGGIQSLDGMHPSGVTYGLIAILVAKHLFKVNLDAADEMQFMDRVLRAEKLLIDYPYDLNLFLDILHTFTPTLGTQPKAVFAQSLHGVGRALLNA